MTTTPQDNPQTTGSAPEVHRILVIEDMPALQAHIAETLTDLGDSVVVHKANDGREALQMIDQASEPYQLIMCDIIMPRLDGEAVLTELRRRDYPAAVIMLTALGQDDMIVRCLRQGACDYLVKPVGIDELTAAAANALQHMPLVGRSLEVEYDPHGWFEVAGESDPAILYKYRRFFGLLDKFKIAEPAASEVRLALEELGRNAIEWGNHNDRAKKVRFGCRILPGKIIVYIEDEGEGFDPNHVPDPSVDPIAHLERRKSDGKRLGGYGIHLIKHLMDKLIYNARGNRVVAIKYLDKTAV
ncbi:MAG TPA: response regulator [Planctomycetota bacterium]|nr:response regulator [Planctomycetota bacterium]